MTPHRVTVISVLGNYSRDVAMKTGSQEVNGGDLALFSDVDVLVDESAVDRCVHFAVKGKAAYFPLHFVYVAGCLGEVLVLS